MFDLTPLEVPDLCMLEAGLGYPIFPPQTNWKYLTCNYILCRKAALANIIQFLFLPLSPMSKTPFPNLVIVFGDLQILDSTSQLFFACAAVCRCWALTWSWALSHSVQLWHNYNNNNNTNNNIIIIINKQKWILRIQKCIPLIWTYFCTFLYFWDACCSRA